MSPEMKAKLEEIANEGCWSDNWDDDTIVDDFAGGNVDDAFNGGCRDGRVTLARELLAEFAGPQ